ncbi:MAG: Ku protein [Pseudonocardiaceae bacterium]|nr:Ku protein [Pseudonocardiaceae bacterium]
MPRCSGDGGRHPARWRTLIAMRAIWKGAVSFGLVSIPVRLHAATEDRDVSFHQVHAADGGRVRYRRVCSACGEEIAYADLAKGYELASGETVVLTEEDLAGLPLPTAKTVELLAFVPAEQLDPLAYARGYHLDPEQSGRKPYLLLRRALEASGRVGLVKVAIRSKEALAVLRPRGQGLVLQTMVWPDEVRPGTADELDDDVSVNDAEVAVATALIDAMAADYEPQQHTDAYREALLAVVDAKAAGSVVAPAAAEEERPEVIDLVSALQASVTAARAARSAS